MKLSKSAQTMNLLFTELYNIRDTCPEFRTRNIRRGNYEENIYFNATGIARNMLIRNLNKIRPVHYSNRNALYSLHDNLHYLKEEINNIINIYTIELKIKPICEDAEDIIEDKAKKDQMLSDMNILFLIKKKIDNTKIHAYPY